MLGKLAKSGLVESLLFCQTLAMELESLGRAVDLPRVCCCDY